MPTPDKGRGRGSGVAICMACLCPFYAGSALLDDDRHGVLQQGRHHLVPVAGPAGCSADFPCSVLSCSLHGIPVRRVAVRDNNSPYRETRKAEQISQMKGLMLAGTAGPGYIP